jgi:hypothetical protein
MELWSVWGEPPLARYLHASARHDDKILIFGGMGGDGRLNDLWMLDTRVWNWARMTCSGLPPSPRNGHTLTSLEDGTFIVYGGVDTHGACCDMFRLDTDGFLWTLVESSEEEEGEAGGGGGEWPDDLPAAPPAPLLSADGLPLVTSIMTGGAGGTGTGGGGGGGGSSRLACIPPPRRSGHTATYVNAELWILCGCDDKGTVGGSDAPRGGSGRGKSSSSSSSSSSSMHANPAGREGSTLLLTAFSLSRETWSSKRTEGIPPSPRFSHDTALIGKSLQYSLLRTKLTIS